MVLVEFRNDESFKPKKGDKPQHRKGDKLPHYDGKEKLSQKKDGLKDGKEKVKRKHNYYLCNVDYWVTNCLKKKAFNAMFNELEEKQLKVPPATAANISCL